MRWNAERRKRTRERVRGWGLGVVWGLAGLAPAIGQFEERETLPEVSPAEAGYAVRHWTVADGLPGQSITALAQTRDGYLWCGTSDALVRYDGARFRTFFSEEVPELAGIEIERLSVDRGGRLWIWGERNRLSVLAEGRFRAIGEAEGLAAEWVRPVTSGGFGDCWFVSGPEERLHRFDGGTFQEVPQAPGAHQSATAAGEKSRLRQVLADESGPQWAIMDRLLGRGDRWAANRDRRLVRLAAGRAEDVEVTGKGSRFQLEMLFAMPDGTAALVSRDGIYVVRDGEWVSHHRFDRAIPRSHGALRGVAADGRGNYWIGTNDGGLVLSEPDRTTRRFVLPEEERRPTIGALCVDRSGNLWAGSRDGLYQVVRKAARSWGRAEGLPEDEVVAVAAGKDDRVWMASEEALVSVSPDGLLGDPQFVPRDDLVQRVIIQRVAPSADGSLWVAMRSFRVETQRWHHELLKAKNGSFVFVTSVDQPVMSLHELGDGSLLVGTINGLFAWRGGSLQRVPLPDLKVADEEWAHLAAMTGDQEGRVVAAVFTAGLYRRDGTGWSRLTHPARDDRQGRHVRALGVGPDGTIWAGCGRHGLACWHEGEWKSFADLKARLPREITGVAADDTGGVWLTSTTGEGLVRLDGGELLAWWENRDVDPTATHFGRQDGLPSIVAHAGYTPVLRDAAGRIWIATKLGAAVVQPGEWQRRREEERPPEVHLQEVGVNDKLAKDFLSGAGAGMPELVVPPGPRRVEFRYVGIDLAAPEEVRYRYRLEGYEEGWTEAGERAVAVYPDLPPGQYVFRVAAAGRYGLWNEAGAGAVVTVQPLWWERTGTRVLAAALVLGLLSLGYFYRLRQIQAQTAMQEEFSRALIWSQEAERKRLASELHDGLGHELLVLKGGIDRELVPQRGPDDGGTGQALSSKAREVIHRVREISHDLRPPELERYGIAPALESAALATAELTGIELSIELDAPARRLRPVVEISLFRIAQEALSNMARHSDASEGRVMLSHGEDTITLALEDDGRGFDPAGVERARRGPGLGLAGMEERVHLLGGTWECRSAPGNGTRITVTVPLLYREDEGNQRANEAGPGSLGD